MTERKLSSLPEIDFHLIYDDATGSFRKVEGRPHWSELSGGFSELAKGDFWGAIRREDDSKVYFHNGHMYPDDPERFLVFVDILGPTQARVHYVLDGKTVEETVYTRVSGVGVNPFDAFEEDLDKLMFFSKQHEPRRAKWPELFAK